MPLKLGPDLRVLLVDTAGAALSVGGGTQYADGATQANPTGNVVLWLDTANAIRAASAAKPLPVNVITGGGGSQTDASAWTTAVTSFAPGGGVFNDSAADLTSGQQGTLRMTAKRAQHMNLRNASAAEIGVAAAPLVVAGAKTNNNAAPGATNAGVLGGLANAAAPSWSEGNQVGFSADLSGATRVTGPLDAGAWTTATSGFHPVGGVFNDSAAALTAGQQGTERLTAQRGLHVNLRNNTGSEIGVAALPLLMAGPVAGGAAEAFNSISIGFVGTGGTHRNATAAPSVNSTTGTDIIGVGNLVKGTTNFFSQQGDDSGNTKTVGSIAHDGVDSGNPHKMGFKAIAHGANPTAVSAADRSDWYSNVAGVPFVIGGHPNVQTFAQNYTSAQTNAAVITVAAGTKIVVTGFMVTAANSNTVDTSVRLGFATATTPAYGAAQLVGTHPGVAAGSGFGRGGGSGIIGIGADDEDLRITMSVPTGGSCDCMVSYYTVPT